MPKFEVLKTNDARQKMPNKGFSMYPYYAIVSYQNGECYTIAGCMNIKDGEKLIAAWKKNAKKSMFRDILMRD